MSAKACDSPENPATSHPSSSKASTRAFGVPLQVARDLGSPAEATTILRLATVLSLEAIHIAQPSADKTNFLVVHYTDLLKCAITREEIVSNGI